MTDSPRRRLPVGRIAGHRGRNGEVTVRVFDGDAGFWSEVRQVWIRSGSSTTDEVRKVVSSRAYRDRWVVRLEGIEDATAAAALRGSTVSVDTASAPRLAPGRHYRDSLLGLEVRDHRQLIGRVIDILTTSGQDLLVVRGPDDGAAPSREFLVPWVDEIVVEVDAERGWIRIRPPEGLLELDGGGSESGP